MKIMTRIVLTILLFVGYSAIALLYSPNATLLSGQVAGRQLDDSDIGYLTSNYWINFLGGMNVLLLLVLLVLLALIWFVPIRSGIDKFTASLTGIFLLCFLFYPHPSQAYFDQTERTEAYTILPNESAFWIPDVGANKESQQQMDSEDYLKTSKVATKRVIIPHQKLGNSGGWAGWDYYVPVGRLIIVDRTPYSREWVKSEARGTAAIDQSFPCQSKEGLNIGVGVSVGVSVHEDNAAKFLYHFGTLPPKGNRNDPAVIFTSVYYGRSLADVMDDVGRKKVQTLVCGEITKRTFDQANSDAGVIMDIVQKAALEYFAANGITLDFIGYADTWEFDKDVQQAINDRYAANAINPVLDVLKTKAALDSVRKWNGALPTSFTMWWMPTALTDWFMKWFEPAAAPVTVSPPAKQG